MLQSIKAAILRFGKRKDMKARVEGERVKEDWENIMKKANIYAASRTKAISLTEQGELVVKVANPVLLQELRFSQEEIKKCAQAHSKEIKTIRFTV